MDTSTKSYSHSYGHSNKELLRNNAHIHLFCQVTRVIKCFQFGPIRRYKYEHGNRGVHFEAEHRTTNKKKERGGKITEQRGHEKLMPLNIRRYIYEHSNHGVHSEAENRTSKRNKTGRKKTEERRRKRL